MENKNEPAYPLTWNFKNGEVETYPGLSKRELIAAMAMQGMLANMAPDLVSMPDEKLVKHSVNLADALLEQLDK